MSSTEVTNILSIDLEEWDQLAYRRFTGQWPPPSTSIFRQIDSVLELLNVHRAKATFFTVGVLAQREPSLIATLYAEGHEIACHGHDHLLVDRLTPAEFRRDTEKCKSTLERIIGARVTGYRAAEFSIRRSSLWALEVLAELGFEYDSSIFPVRHRRYGIPDFSPEVRTYELRNGLRITELPPASVGFSGVRLPIAGGGYFRFATAAMLNAAVRRLNLDQIPFVTYFHPYEFDPQSLDVSSAAPPRSWKERLNFARFNFHQNLRRTTLPAKLSDLLEQFRFSTFRDYLSGANISDGTAILSATRN